jgi:uncharacterized protein (UPF0332 family)
MSHVKNKLDWCLKKAEKELLENKEHRGLRIINPDKNKARAHLKKAEHYLRATDYLKRGNFGDISTSTVFYSMYHCMLAIATKFGYESRNQECTFALIAYLIESKSIDFEQTLLDKIAVLNVNDENRTSLKIREEYQYGTNMTLDNESIYLELSTLAKEIILKTRVIIEK